MSRSAPAVMIAALLGILLGCGRESARLPDDLCGRWVTDDPRFEDRYLELSNETIRFGHGDEELDASAVVEIQRSGACADIRYDIAYLDSNGDESVFTFDHQVTRGCIRITHSPQRQWKKWVEPEPPSTKVEKKQTNPER